MNTLFYAVLMLLVFVMGGLTGYVIALMQELLETKREINDIELRIAEHMTEIEATEEEIERLEREIKAHEDNN